MQMNSILMASWAVLTMCFLGLFVYFGQLTRYEDHYLSLGTAADTRQLEHTAVARKMTRLEPVLHVFGGAAGLLTAGAVATYVWSAWQQIQ